MKALTDKIIEALEARAHGQSNVFTRGQLQFAIEEIKEIEREAEFEEVARVMMKHLGQADKYHPHYSVITTNSTCELLVGQKALGKIMDYVPD